MHIHTYSDGYMCMFLGIAIEKLLEGHKARWKYSLLLSDGVAVIVLLV